MGLLEGKIETGNHGFYHQEKCVFCKISLAPIQWKGNPGDSFTLSLVPCNGTTSLPGHFSPQPCWATRCEAHDTAVKQETGCSHNLVHTYILYVCVYIYYYISTVIGLVSQPRRKFGLLYQVLLDHLGRLFGSLRPTILDVDSNL